MCTVVQYWEERTYETMRLVILDVVWIGCPFSSKGGVMLKLCESIATVMRRDGVGEYLPAQILQNRYS